jgi:hypothetical protein
MPGTKRFSTAPITAPTAGEAIPNSRTAPAGVQAPRSPEVQAPRRPGVTTATPVSESVEVAARIAFTWRLTPGQADQLDSLVLRLRRQLGRGRLDKASVLLALVELADENDEIRAAILGRLKTS